MNSALRGKRIVVTRPAERSQALINTLISRGALPVAIPLIRIAPLTDSLPLRHAIQRLLSGSFDWVMFTSQYAVEAVASFANWSDVASLRLAAIGPGTASAIADRFGRSPDFVSPIETAAGFAERLPLQPQDRVLLPQSSIAPHTAEIILRERGAEVTAFAAYETTINPDAGAEIVLLEADGCDAIVFASGSAIDAFVELSGEVIEQFRYLPVLCIGGSTAEVAASNGFFNFQRADSPSVEGIIDALERQMGRSNVVQESFR